MKTFVHKYILNHKYLLELLGTFLFTIAVTLTSNPLCIGFMLTSLMAIGYHISGAHFNPAVSLAHCMKHRIHWHQLPFFILAQTIGAFLALLLFKGVTGSNFTADIAPELSLWIASCMEALLVAVFCLVILTIIELHPNAPSKEYSAHLAIIAGFSYMSISIIGGLFNPAIGCASILQNLVSSNSMSVMTPCIIHIISPMAGATAAVYLHRFFNDSHR
jgi:aquaporin Z